jgi:hypothetical protein
MFRAGKSDNVASQQCEIAWVFWSGVNETARVREILEHQRAATKKEPAFIGIFHLIPR